MDEKKRCKEFTIGDLIALPNDEKKYIVVAVENREDTGSCCYDRTYKLLPIDKTSYLSEERFYSDNNCINFDVIGGVYFPAYTMLAKKAYVVNKKTVIKYGVKPSDKISFVRKIQDRNNSINICSNCNYKIDSNFNFCPRCGLLLIK